MNQFKRYINRIFIPAAIVVVITLAVRFRMQQDFAEENVLPISPTTTSTLPLKSLGGTTGVDLEPARAEIVEDLQSSRNKLDESFELKRDDLDPKVEAEAEQASQRLAESIAILNEANSKVWEEQIEEVVERLEAYAQLISEADQASRES